MVELEKKKNTEELESVRFFHFQTEKKLREKYLEMKILTLHESEWNAHNVLLSDPLETGNTMLCVVLQPRTCYIHHYACSILGKFLQDLLYILKRMLQNI